MKKTLLLPMLLLLVACADNGYKIKGTASQMQDGMVVYMTAWDEAFTIIDSAVVKNGRFEFDGYCDRRMVRMLLAPKIAVGGPVVLENGVINVGLDGGDIVRGGSDGNRILQSFTQAKAHLRELTAVTSPEFLKAMPVDKNLLDSLLVARDTARDKFAEYAVLAIEQNINNSLGAYMLAQAYEYIDIYRLDVLLNMLPAFLRDSRYDFVREYADCRLVSSRNLVATMPGNSFIDFELPDINGEKVVFSAIVSSGRYTFLQFWASWCAPCRAELPEFVDVYRKYKSKGLVVAGVSLDDNIDECRACVEKLKMDWLQFCSPSGGCSEIAATYGVGTIPANLLINNKGVVIARDLSPRELDSLLAESCGNS